MIELNPSFLIRQKVGNDVWDNPFICCEYLVLSLVNKEDALAYNRQEW